VKWADRAGRRTGVSAAAKLLVTSLAVAAGLVAVQAGSAQASTAGIRGVNWADQRDNFVNGVLYPSGLSASDTYSSAATVANQVVGQLYSLTGANTVRIPINEPTVANYWGTYTGAIDTALTKGNVIFAYWAYTGGKPQNTTAFFQMWDKVVAQYGGNAQAYFEVINEPSGYSNTDLTNMYNTWLTRYPAVPRGRVVLDGAGLATNVSAVGNDSRLNGTLIAVHDYTFFVGNPYTSESAWANHLAGLVGGFASRTVATEWGAPMSPGSKNGVHYDTIDYSKSGGNYFNAYVRGISSELRALGMGSVYWPGLRDGDWYSMTTRTGSGADIRLSVPNQSGLARLQYAWGTVNTVSVTSPGNRTGTVGTPVTPVQITATDSDASQSLTYTASGLPPGLSISASGSISGTPTTAGTSSVTVTARDASGASGTATFTWTITGPSPSPSPSASPSASPSSSPGPTGSCHVSYAATEWPGGFTANITINNLGTSPVNGWTLTFTYPGDQKVSNAWNATVTQSGPAVTATNASYNGTIAPGGNATFGFQGTWTANDSPPTAFRVNGAACS
jgi:hypothetical protein